MNKMECKDRKQIKAEGFEILIVDQQIIMDDYQLFIDITPDEFKCFNDIMFSIYNKYNLLEYYIEDLDSYLDDLYYMALFDDNLAIINFEYFVNRMALLFNIYGHTEIVGTNFFEVKKKINRRKHPKIVNLDTYKQYRKIINNQA